MYYKGGDHNPPHVHARYGSCVAEIDVMSGDVLEGKLPNKAATMVKEWVILHSSELLEIWETQEFKKIKPLE